MSGIDPAMLEQLGLGGSARNTEKPNDKLGQEDFLKLMITQLSNQDPFDPMESGDFLGQIAQFGTVNGIQELQGSINALGRSLQGNRALEAAALIDRSVMVPSSEGWLPPEGEMHGAVELPKGANSATVDIIDLSGRLVQRLQVDATAEGRAGFSWDGTDADGQPVAPGFYAVEAQVRDGDHTIGAGVLMSGRVESVGIDNYNGAVTLTVTGLGNVDMDKVRVVN